MSESAELQTSHSDTTASASDSTATARQEDASNTPFATFKLFYLVLASAIVLLLGSVLAYML